MMTINISVKEAIRLISASGRIPYNTECTLIIKKTDYVFSLFLHDEVQEWALISENDKVICNSIEAIALLTPYLKKSKWIKVEDGFPEPHNERLSKVVKIKTVDRKTKSYYLLNGRSWIDIYTGNEIENVIAWTPIKEKNESN